MSNKGPPPINYATRPTPINNAVRRPPLINYSTHPRWTALTYGGTQAASAAAPPIVTGAATATSSTVDVHDDSVDSLGDPFDGVSTNDVSQVTLSSAVTVSPTSAFSPALRRRRGKDMYYSVIVGKCCGIYFSWATVHPLVINVPGSFYTEFRSLEGAYWDYNKAKEEGKVRAVREPGDEETYGPLSRACL